MRVMEWKFNGRIDSKPEDHWTPVLVPFGSNIRGRRFKQGTVFIEPNELEKQLTNSTESLNRIREFLDTLRLSYYKAGND